MPAKKTVGEVVREKQDSRSYLHNYAGEVEAYFGRGESCQMEKWESDFSLFRRFSFWTWRVPS